MEQKKKNNVVLLVIAAIAVYFLFFNNSGSELEGRWEDEYGDIIEFKDGKLMNEYSDITFDYKVSGNTLTISYMGESNSTNFKIVDGVLYIDFEGDDYMDGDSYTKVTD